MDVDGEKEEEQGVDEEFQVRVMKLSCRQARQSEQNGWMGKGTEKEREGGEEGRRKERVEVGNEKERRGGRKV